MSEVSVFRLYLLRGMYLLIVVGLGITIWPGILSPPPDLSHMASVVRSVLGAVSLLALLGIRYPLKMLPLLFFELLWKIIWVLAFGLPLWRSGQLTAGGPLEASHRLAECCRRKRPDTTARAHSLDVNVFVMVMVLGFIFVPAFDVARTGDQLAATART